MGCAWVCSSRKNKIKDRQIYLLMGLYGILLNNLRYLALLEVCVCVCVCVGGGGHEKCSFSTPIYRSKEFEKFHVHR